MKLEFISADFMEIFLNNYNFYDIDIFNRDELLSSIKEIILKINKRYDLHLVGFFKVNVYPCDKIGVFLNIIKIDDNEFSNDADFRIVILYDEKFLYETDDYDVISKIDNKNYYNGYFYVNVKDLDDDFKYYDMGRFVYGEELQKIML